MWRRVESYKEEGALLGGPQALADGGVLEGGMRVLEVAASMSMGWVMAARRAAAWRSRQYPTQKLEVGNRGRWEGEVEVEGEKDGADNGVGAALLRAPRLA